MSKFKLSRADLQHIEQDTSYKAVIAELRVSNQFNVGDYCVMLELGTVATNAYGTPHKFVVVHKSDDGVCYIKRVSSKGNPSGPIMSMVGDYEGEVTFQLDPGFVDAVILENKDGYDAVEQQRKKKATRDEIVAHNKACKISLSDYKSIIAFWNQVKVGDVLWSSAKKSMTVTNIITDHARKYIHVTLSNGKTAILGLNELKHKALYRAQPRSYKELQNPNL